MSPDILYHSKCSNTAVLCGPTTVKYYLKWKSVIKSPLAGLDLLPVFKIVLFYRLLRASLLEVKGSHFVYFISEKCTRCTSCRKSCSWKKNSLPIQIAEAQDMACCLFFIHETHSLVCASSATSMSVYCSLFFSGGQLVWLQSSWRHWKRRRNHKRLEHHCLQTHTSSGSALPSRKQDLKWKTTGQNPLYMMCGSKLIPLVIRVGAFVIAHSLQGSVVPVPGPASL